MTVYQIRDAMILVSGGIQWGEIIHIGMSMQTYSVCRIIKCCGWRSSPSLMFQKFLDDAALSCTAWIDEEAPGKQSVFFVEPYDAIDRASVMSNIVHLRWQIREKTEASKMKFERLWATLLRFINTESSVESWLTVCTAMFTHPDFFIIESNPKKHN